MLEEKRLNLDELYMSPCRLVFCLFSKHTHARTHAHTHTPTHAPTHPPTHNNGDMIIMILHAHTPYHSLCRIFPWTVLATFPRESQLSQRSRATNCTSSVPSEVECERLGRPICAPSHLSEVLPMLHLLETVPVLVRFNDGFSSSFRGNIRWAVTPHRHLFHPTETIDSKAFVESQRRRARVLALESQG